MRTAIRYEADGRGCIYAEYEDGAILPSGLKLPALAGRSEITRPELLAAIASVAPPPTETPHAGIR